eukprot:CFRG4455T1
MCRRTGVLGASDLLVNRQRFSTHHLYKQKHDGISFGRKFFSDSFCPSGITPTAIQTIRNGHVRRHIQTHQCHYTTLREGFSALPMCTKALCVVVGLPALLYAYKAVMTVIFQNKLIYMPYLPPGSRTYIQDPHNFGLGEVFSEHRFKTADGIELQAWLFKQNQQDIITRMSNVVKANTQNTPTNTKNTPLILYFHGNAGNLGDRLHHIKRLYKESECHLFVVSYRGYGHSGGRPSGKGLAEDANAALAFVCRNMTNWFPKAMDVPIVVYGHSIGGAVAIHLTAKDTENVIRGLIVENTFTSVGHVIKFWYPKWTPYPYLVPFIRWPWESVQHITTVTCPILFLSGERDEMIPSFMMKQLHDSSTSAYRTKFVSIPRGLHNDTWTRQGYYSSITHFIAQL